MDDGSYEESDGESLDDETTGGNKPSANTKDKCTS